MPDTILVVEDDMTLQETIAYNLKRQGYRVLVASSGSGGLEKARNSQPNLVILDVMLPEIDGFEVCRVLRRESNVPVLMLTARGEEIDRIVGLEVGADDYLTKPFSMRELMARVKAHLRRVRLIREEVQDTARPRASSQKILAFENLEINLERREVSLDQVPIRLKPQEYELLVFLAHNRGIALSRDLILERVWGWENDSSRTVDVHVRWLREKIEPDPSNARRIITVRGVGYRFEG